MKLKTIDSSKITWTIYPADEYSLESYCADGDGLVQIKSNKSGSFDLYDELELLANFTSLSAALEGGQMWLANDYNEVFQSVRHHNETQS
jgi:hypothetical protein